MRFLGFFLAIVYRFNRHYWLGLPLSVWVELGLVGGALFSMKRAHPAVPYLLLALAVAYALLYLIGLRARYALFRPTSGKPGPPPDVPQPDTEIAVWLTGRLAVHEQTRTLAHQPATLTTPRSREHILMTELKRSRLLLLASSRPEEWGWWYQFIKPEAIVDLEWGQLHHGWRPQPAIRITHRVERKEDKYELEKTILAFENHKTRLRAWSDLSLDWTPPPPNPSPAKPSR